MSDPTSSDPAPSQLDTDDTTVVVVGAGLAGLTAAITAARGGAKVTVLDARSEIGGRARSHPSPEDSGALFNEGPHALYCGGEAQAILATLGIQPSGNKPAAPVWVAHNDSIEVLPNRVRDAFRKQRVKLPAMTPLARLLTLGGGPEPQPGQTMADWIAAATANPDASALLKMLTRVATYCDDMDGISAPIAVSQVRSASRRGVLYIDGGWQSLVDGLREAALREGVVIRTGSKATSVSGVGSDSGITVTTGAGDFGADSVVLAAGGPSTAAELLEAGGNASAELARAVAAAQPVRGTTLEVHLAKLPVPARRVCFPTGEPLYLSVHTPSANLAPAGEVMHLMHYGEHDESVRAQMEDFADRVQPGWRDQVLSQRYGRALVVAHDRPNGADTTTVEVADSPGVFVAGDWVFPTDKVLLADAAVLSARMAGEAATATSRITREARVARHG